MTGLPPNSDAVLEWGIRAALLSYMSSGRDFEIATSGGATFSVEEGGRMTGRTDADGVLRLDGAIILRAHVGALTVPLVDVRIDGATLTIDDPGAEEADAGTDAARLALVTLSPVSGAAEGTYVFETRLASAADALFMYNYIPDTPFDPLRIRIAAA